jgi:integrase
MDIKDVRVEDILARYENALTEYGLGFATRLRSLQRVLMVVRRHEHQGLKYFSPTILADYAHEHDEKFCNGTISKNHYQMLRREIQRFTCFIETGEVMLPNTLKGSRYVLAPKFEEIADGYLVSCGLHPNTRNDARWVTHKYFVWLKEQGHEDLSVVGAEQIQKFLLYCSGRLTPGGLHDVKLHLTKLCAYLYEIGLAESSYAALLSFKINRETKIYPTLPKEQLARMLDAIDRRTVGGKRAYAVMLLGAVLGLRACDVVALKLTDIDWVRGEIRILQSKTANTVVLPLTEDVGEALSDYILNGRPKTTAKQVFIRLLAPYTEIKSAVTVGEIYRDCCKAIGLPPSKSFHTLRRTLGTAMITGGVSVETAAQVFGDADVDSMKKYISLDSIHLKLCALPFDGITPLGGDAR